VRFTAGAVTTTQGRRSVEPLGSLTLELIDENGNTVRELTPTGGAKDLLPGEYAYTLTKAARNRLKKGSYSFRASATGPAGGQPTIRRSPAFRRR
jgi:hypothetical protein